MQRETKEVLAELVEKLTGKLELKARTMSERKGGQRAELGPNLDRLTAGVDLGDQWSNYCILGLEGEMLSEGQVGTTQADVAFDNIGQEEVCLFLRELLRHLRGQVIVVLDNSSLVSVERSYLADAAKVAGSNSRTTQ